MGIKKQYISMATHITYSQITEIKREGSEPATQHTLKWNRTLTNIHTYWTTDIDVPDIKLYYVLHVTDTRIEANIDNIILISNCLEVETDIIFIVPSCVCVYRGVCCSLEKECPHISGPFYRAKLAPLWRHG